MDKRVKPLILILVLIAFVSALVAFWAVFLRDPTPVLPPDELPSLETNAIPTEDEAKMDQPEGGGSVNITYSDQVSISLSGQEVGLYFSNPSRSNQSMVLEIIIQDVTVAQSGALPPGYLVETLPLLGTAKLSAGTYEGKFHVLFYDSEGGKAILDTEIPVNITVT